MLETLHFYNHHATRLATRYRQQEVRAWHETLLRWIPRGSRVLELGCGSGRDARFLTKNQRTVLATDASDAMLEIAHRLDPKGHYQKFFLPIPTEQYERQLSNLQNKGPYQAIYCMALLHHFPMEVLRQIAPVIDTLLDPKEGVFLCCVAINHPQVEGRKRYYNQYPIEAYQEIWESFGFRLMQIEKTQGGLPHQRCRWATLVFSRPRGVRQAQSDLQKVLQQEQKTASYKFALIRALCDVNLQRPYQARYLSHQESSLLFAKQNRTRDTPTMVAIPTLFIMESFLSYYWHFLYHFGRHCFQIHTSRNLAFGKELLALIARFRMTGNACDTSMWAWETFREHYYRNQLTSTQEDLFIRVLQKLYDTLRKGPVYYIGQSLQKHSGRGNQWFFMGKKQGRLRSVAPLCLESYFGDLYCPASLWHELHRSAILIRDATLLQWFQFSQNLAQGAPTSVLQGLFEALLPSYSERSTDVARKILETLLQKYPRIPCVWTNQRLTRTQEIDIDHIIPWSKIHNNDLWNLMPTSAKVNRQKGDKSVATHVLRQKKNAIIRVWNWWAESDPILFTQQAEQSLLMQPWSRHTWENDLFEALLSYNHHIATQMHNRIWTPT